MFLGVIQIPVLNAQDVDVDNNSSFSVSADFVSRYIWRGMVSSPTPNIQSEIYYTYKNFSIGAWGSADVLGTAKEIDIIMSYSVKGFSITVSDLYWNTDKRYFNFGNQTTGHYLEVGLNYQNEKFPLNIYAGTMVYGEDKKMLYDVLETDMKKQNYSTYYELSYPFSIKQSELNVFVGGTPFTGIYGKDFAVVYAGMTATKDIEITDKFSLSIFATFAANPQTEDFFTIFGISI